MPLLLKDEYIRTLTDLGLTLVQAKSYLALCRLDNATIKTISKTSNLARQDIYRIMPTLQNMGLAEKIIANPTKYKAIPIKNGISALLQHRAQEQAKLQKKTTELLKNIQEEGFTQVSSAEEEPQLLIISELSHLFKKLMEGTRATQISIDSIGTWEAFDGVTSNGFADFKKALREGVRLRAITEKPPNGKIPNYVKTLQKHPLYEVRFVSPPAPVTMVVMDRKELCICISMSTSRTASSLWSNNSVITGLAINYFEEIWSKASKSKQQKNREVEPSAPQKRKAKAVNNRQKIAPS